MQFLQKRCMSSLAYPVEKGVSMCIFPKKSACPCWSTLLKRASLCAFCFDVSVGRFQGAATADFLAGISVGRLQGAATANSLSGIFWGRLQGAATANFLAGVSVGRLQGAAIANFLAAFLWVAYRAVFAIS